LNEGGQSGAGAAIHQLIGFHPAFHEAHAYAASEGLALPDWLAARAAARVSQASDVARRASGLIVVPDFLGNRSPHADPDARAVIAGLGMERDLDHLVALYVAGLLGIGYGLRQIIETSRERGACIEAVVLSGGAARHPLIQQLLADCAGLPVLAPEQADPVLLGAAMLGATAGGAFPDLSAAMQGMAPATLTFEPATGAIARLHEQRFAAFESLQKAARRARDPSSEI
jgi:D-ribulokinase